MKSCTEKLLDSSLAVKLEGLTGWLMSCSCPWGLQPPLLCASAGVWPQLHKGEAVVTAVHDVNVLSPWAFLLSCEWERVVPVSRLCIEKTKVWNRQAGASG